MRTLMMTAVLTIALGAGAALGFADTAHAAPGDDVTLAQVAATLNMSAGELDALLEDGGDEERRRPKLRRRVKARLLHSLRRACPCNGPDGEGWGENGHEAFVDCVEAKLAEMDRLPDELEEKILERAENSEVGNEDFECPERKERGERPPREPREPGGGGKQP